MPKKILCAASGLIFLSCPIISQAQQNLFNVPSSDITEAGRFFFQQQFNFSSSANSNTTIDYGLGNQLEVGINLFSFDIYNDGGAFTNPNLLFNFQKAFQINAGHTVSIGTQTGFTPPISQSGVLVPSFSYLSNAIDKHEWGKYYLGAYVANHAYTGDRSSLGFMAGIDYPLAKESLHLMADLISGNSGISVAVLGVVWYLPAGWQLSFGAQAPAPDSSSQQYGMVFEITKL